MAAVLAALAAVVEEAWEAPWERGARVEVAAAEGRAVAEYAEVAQ